MDLYTLQAKLPLLDELARLAGETRSFPSLSVGHGIVGVLYSEMGQTKWHFFAFLALCLTPCPFSSSASPFFLPSGFFAKFQEFAYVRS